MYMYKLLDGRMVAEKIKDKIRRQVIELKKKNIILCLAVVLVGKDPASILYVSMKEKQAHELGIKTKNIHLSKTISEGKLLDTIEKLNHQKDIQAILVQLPLPKHISTNKIIAAISPNKDVDGLHPENVGKLLLGEDTVIAPTAAGIMEILKYYKISLTGKHVVIVGYGKLVGKPLAAMIGLSNQLATLTVCNHKTKNLAYYTNQADILVSATGRANLIKKNMIKRGCVVVDAGTTRVGGKIVGDVDFENVKEKASYITPSKGGVGPMTVAMLLENVVTLINYSCNV